MKKYFILLIACTFLLSGISKGQVASDDMLWYAYIGAYKVHFNKDDSKIMAFNYGGIYVLNTKTGYNDTIIKSITAGEYTGDEDYLVTKNGQKPGLVNMNTYAKSDNFEPYYKNLLSVSVSKNNLIACITDSALNPYKQSVIIWDMNTGRIVDSVVYGWADKVSGIYEKIHDAKLTPDGKYLITNIIKMLAVENEPSSKDKGISTDVRIIQLSDKKLIKLINDKMYIWISKAGLYLCSIICCPLPNVDTALNVYEIETGKEILTIPGLNGTVKDVTFTPEDSYMAVAYGSGDLKIDLWDIKEKVLINTYSDEPPNGMNGVDFSHNLKYLAATDGGGKVYLFKTPWYTSVVENNTIKATISYPNPVQNVINLDFELLSSGLTKINILDLTGIEIKTLFNKFLDIGIYHQSYSLNELSSGAYILKIQSGNDVFSNKIIINK